MPSQTVTTKIMDRKTRHLESLRRIIREKAGINLPDGKTMMIESRLTRRLTALGMPDVASYLAYVMDEGGLEDELPELIDLLTTNKTDFFREPAHFRLLTDHILPEAMARARNAHKVQFRAWSAASSTGAEAWTIAMLLARAAQKDPRLDWRILGTDISRRVLAQAQKAIYPAVELAPVPEDMKRDFVMTGKGTPPRGRIVPELRARVRFESLNLSISPYRVDRNLDVVFLRNVLIYFDPDLQQRVILGCASHLRDGGYLIVGHSESMMVCAPDLHQVAPGAFRKGGAA